MKLYLSGGITGIINFRAIFKENQKKLEDAGYEVLNPLDIPACSGWTCGGIWTANRYQHEWRCNLRYDIAAMVFCDGIAMIEGWQESTGATLERSVFDGLLLPGQLVEKWVYDAGE